MVCTYRASYNVVESCKFQPQDELCTELKSARVIWPYQMHGNTLLL